MGLNIDEHDLVLADCHVGAMVPAEIISKLSAATATLLAAEQIILGPAGESEFEMEKLEAAGCIRESTNLYAGVIS